ncbi:PspA/IM30 family protein [Sediminitomix flava]|uniref:Phage shock protein A (PspA) family protein n=1 Tax=Sediminitomix flava TaxID=379075 RepID=A0A315ZBR0_SEDFL|nr:PspA/IM30 family protein [Sediminitomix flava]PWJ42981.1 phage shock protein A (PspA) family protein [Sediminitomix flava]
MFGWLKRMFGIAQAEANSALDKLEDPVKMTEQGIRDLKGDLTKSLQGLAEVKAMAIREKKSLEAAERSSKDYEEKAILLIQKAERGEIPQEEADRLASQALAKKEQIDNRLVGARKNATNYDQMVTKMEGNVQKLKTQISEWENELKTLKARATVSKATAKLNKQLSSVDSSDTLARLERMKQKVDEQEALAESYGEVAELGNNTVDDEIDKALGGAADTTKAIESDALKQLKAKMSSSSTKEESTSSNTTQDTTNNSSSSSSTSEDPNSISELDRLKQKLKDKE